MQNYYPIAFSDSLLQGKDSYPIYWHRDVGHKETIRGWELDNKWVIPYNPYLLHIFNCHINVEACGSIKAVNTCSNTYTKAMIMRLWLRDANKSDSDVDEIKQY
jgi:hypothetical protein